MKLIATALTLTLVFAAASYAQKPTQQALVNPCKTGQLRGFAHVRGDPRIGIGSLPSTLTRQQNQFAVRYNCTRIPVHARRISEGVYEVWFPNNPAQVAVVSAVNSQGASASVYFNGSGKFVVTIRGPLVNNNVLVARELPFYIMVA